MKAAALKRVLVVDDDPIVGKSIDRTLAPRGYIGWSNNLISSMPIF